MGIRLKFQNNRILVNIVKYVIGIILIILLLTRVNIHELLITIKKSNYVLVFLSVAMFGLAGFTLGFRLHVLLKKFGFTLSSSLQILFISIFFNNVTTSVVGDAYKTVIFRKKMASYKNALAILLLERGIGFVVVILILICFTIFAYEEILVIFRELKIGQGILNSNYFYIFIFICVILLLLLKKLFPKFIHIFYDFLKVFKNTGIGIKPINYFLLILWTAVSQLLLALQIYLLIRALNENLSIFDVLFIVILTFIAAYIPVSVGSLGVREGITVIGLTHYGVTLPAATAVAFMSRIIIYLYSGIGGIFFMKFKKQTSHQLPETNDLKYAPSQKQSWYN